MSEREKAQAIIEVFEVLVKHFIADAPDDTLLFPALLGAWLDYCDRHGVDKARALTRLVRESPDPVLDLLFLLQPADTKRALLDPVLRRKGKPKHHPAPLELAQWCEQVDRIIPGFTESLDLDELLDKYRTDLDERERRRFKADFRARRGITG